MRTQLLFALAMLCGGAAAGADEPAAKIPTYPGGEGVMPAVATDAASSFRQYASASAKAATAASDDDAKAGSGLQLTAGVTGLLTERGPRQIVAEPVTGAPAIGPVFGDAGVVTSGGSSSAGGSGSDALVWASASGMVGWTRAVRLPTPLVTSTTGDPAQRLAGAIRLPGTTVLFGSKIDYDTSFGGQFEAGLFLDDSRFFSADIKGFYIAPDDVTFAATSDANGSPLLTRPFFSLAERREAALFTAKPGIASGSIDLKAENEFYGFEVNGRANFGNGGQGVRGSVLTGFRYLRLQDKLTINDRLTPLAANQVSYRAQPVNPPNTLADQDNFETTNDFYGVQIGAQVSVEQSWLLLTAYAKLGFGVTQQKSDISGSTTLVTPAGNDVTAGGQLALSSNIGSRTVDVFGLVPEWGLTLGASVTQNIRVTAGYSFLLWNRVVRTGDTIDRALNPALIPTDASFGAAGGPDRPSPRFNNNDNVFWLHAATLGLEVLF